MTVTGFLPVGVTVDSLVRVTKRHLRAERYTTLNKIAVARDDDDTTFTFTYDLDGINAGAYLELASGEVVYVWSVDANAKTAVVQRGALATEPAAVDIDSLVNVQPRWFTYEILVALRDEIEAWPASLCAVLSVTTELPANDTHVAVTGLEGYTGIRLLGARRRSGLAESDNVRWPHYGAELVPYFADTGLPAGWQLRWLSASGLTGATQLFVGVHFTPQILALGVDIGSIGLTAAMADIPPIGAAMRLVITEETKRVDTEALGRSRTADDVPVGAAAQLSSQLLAWRDRRIAEETNRILSDFGWGVV